MKDVVSGHLGKYILAGFQFWGFGVFLLLWEPPQNYQNRGFERARKNTRKGN